jgi:hypothetical protein
MSIDWSKAPEGTTHYNPNNSLGKWYYELQNRDILCWDVQGEWRSTGLTVESFNRHSQLPLVPRPTFDRRAHAHNLFEAAWDGERIYEHGEWISPDIIGLQHFIDNIENFSRTPPKKTVRERVKQALIEYGNRLNDTIRHERDGFIPDYRALKGNILAIIDELEAGDE